MRALSRRSLFALPLAVPAAGLAALLPAMPKVGDIRTFSIGIDVGALKSTWESFHIGRVWRATDLLRFHERAFTDDDWNDWSFADVARTLGIPYDELPAITDADLAATLGIECAPSQPDPPQG